MEPLQKRYARKRSTLNLRASQVNLQIPIDKELRDEITSYAYEMGFNSLQDFTRVMYKSTLADQLTFHIVPRGYKASKLNLAKEDYEAHRRNNLSKYLKQQIKDGVITEYS